MLSAEKKEYFKAIQGEIVVKIKQAAIELEMSEKAVMAELGFSTTSLAGTRTINGYNLFQREMKKWNSGDDWKRLSDAEKAAYNQRAANEAVQGINLESNRRWCKNYINSLEQSVSVGVTILTRFRKYSPVKHTRCSTSITPMLRVKRKLKYLNPVLKYKDTMTLSST